MVAGQVEREGRRPTWEQPQGWCRAAYQVGGALGLAVVTTLSTSRTAGWARGGGRLPAV